MRRAVLTVLVAFGIAPFVVPLFATPAFSHAEVLTVEPADGSESTGMPARALVVFTEAVTAPADGLVVTGSTGASADLGDVHQPDPYSVAVSLRADAPAGTYQLRFRVVTADSHVITGSRTFGVRPGSALVPEQPDSGQAPTSSPDASASELSSKGEDPAAPTADSGSPSVPPSLVQPAPAPGRPVSAQALSPPPAPQRPGWVLVLGVGGLAALGVAALMLLFVRHDHSDHPAAPAGSIDNRGKAMTAS